MAKNKPDVVDTEPPDEARPETTATPLLVENGKVSPDVEFTPTQLLKVFECLADKHNKSRLHDAAWGIVQAILRHRRLHNWRRPRSSISTQHGGRKKP